ncbi:tellurium resistance protein [Acinetobacter qingfengensis]|uniref:Uncharacterized protein n=1 Tax=Acinetobacter qingfengensis TaxID=1262585 RepID=A0A1E7RDG4_9GAMM|nr:hypothetical protein [Acinetobacter qingfengensis]KAA8735342.1 tellurium resistance protein [Acinetobacter qingfengensis]OEY97333.1 hypothetical protein BJI46_10640 [Acinetobacter qingfengensis]
MTNFVANSFTPIHDMELDQQRIDQIKVKVLVPMLKSPNLLSYYADHIVQQQNHVLIQKTSSHTTDLSQSIQHLIEHLNQSQKSLTPRYFNRFQRWLGQHLEYRGQQYQYIEQLIAQINQAANFSRLVASEMAVSQQYMQELQILRQELAYYVIAAQQFVQESPQFNAQSMQFEHFLQRLQQKINTLMTSQSATDMAMLQMQLQQQVAMTLLDRFTEARQILIPAWQQHVLSIQYQQTPQQLQQLNDARHALIRRLHQALENNQISGDITTPQQ